MVLVEEGNKYYCDFEGDSTVDEGVRVEVSHLEKDRNAAEVKVLHDSEFFDEGETVWVSEEDLYEE